MTTPEPSPAALRELEAVDAALAGRAVEPDLADVAELARALQAERPAPAAGFAAKLDARVAAGFPRPARRRWWSGLRVAVPQAALAVVLLAVVVVPLALLSSPKSGDDSGASGGGGGSSSAPQPTLPSSRFERQSGGGSTAAPAPPAGQITRLRGRAQELSAALTLEAPPDELERVASGVARVADTARGYVARSSVTADRGGGLATFDLRIPARRLSDALAQISELAPVRERTQASTDITGVVRSVRARLAEARAERRGLLRRLSLAPTDDVRAQLRRTNARIARLEAERSRTRRRAQLASVSVTVTGNAPSDIVVDDGRWTPREALGDALRVLEVAGGILLVALAVLLPLLLLAVPLVLLARRGARRGRERALDGA